MLRRAGAGVLALAIAVTAVVVGVLLSRGGGQAGTLGYMYSAKFVCGTIPEPVAGAVPSPLAPGDYATSVLVHNFNPGPIKILKKMVLAPREPNTGTPSLLRPFPVPPDGAFEIDCADIGTLSGAPFPPAGSTFATGFVVLWSENDFDVEDVLSTRRLLAGSGLGMSFENERLRAQRVPPPFAPPAGITNAGTIGTAQSGQAMMIRGTTQTVTLTLGAAAAGAVTFTYTTSDSSCSGTVPMPLSTAGPPFWTYSGSFMVPLTCNRGATLTKCVLVGTTSMGCVSELLIDPSGFVYQAPDTTIRIPKATVTLQRFNGTVWVSMDPVLNFGQFDPTDNPELTLADGSYGWNVVAGTYRVQVSKPGCAPATSPQVTVPPPVTTLNVGLTCPDTDGDGLPDWRESNTGTFVSPTDTGSDPSNPNTSGDGYTDGQHVALGKDPNRYCAIMRADMNSGTSDGAVNGLDLNQLAKYFTQFVPPAPARVDQNNDNAINGLDLNLLARVFTHFVTECP